MRKFIFIIVFFIFFSVLLLGGDKFFVSAGAAAVFPADSRFRDFYGSVQFSPELKAGWPFPSTARDGVLVRPSTV